MSEPTILVTGGAGLIGFEVCRQIAEQGGAVRLLDVEAQVERVRADLHPGVDVRCGSIMVPDDLDDAIRGCDAVIHLAALLGVHRSESQRLRCLHINIDGTRNVLESMVRNHVPKIAFASSSEVYGEPLSNPVREDDVTQGKTVYAVSKLAGEELCRAYAQQFGVRYTILRNFNCYGPYQTAQFVIPKFVYNVLSGRAPVINGDGKQVRCYTYVEDTARATILAIRSEDADGEVLNVGKGDEPINLLDLARLVIRLAGKEGEIEPEVRGGFEDVDRLRDREIHHRFCDPEKAQRLLGWRPTVRLEDGIGRVIESGAIFDRWAEVEDEW
jgi:UDP-glucose 4-epimerase